MNRTFLDTLRGKKTYCAAGLAVLYIAGNVIGLWPWDEKILAVLGFGSLAFLRSALKGTPSTPTADTQGAGVSAGSPVSDSPSRRLAVSLLLSGSLAASLLLAGCAATPTWQDAARKSVHSAVLLADGFLNYELVNRATLDPKITAAADRIRVEMPPAVHNLRAALDAYDANPSPTTQAAVQSGLGVLQALADVAAAALAQAQSP